MRLRAFRRGFLLGIRRPNPYENVHIFLEDEKKFIEDVIYRFYRSK